MVPSGISTISFVACFMEVGENCSYFFRVKIDAYGASNMFDAGSDTFPETWACMDDSNTHTVPQSSNSSRVSHPSTISPDFLPVVF